MKRLAFGLLATLMTLVLVAACAASGEDPTARFCEIAATASEPRDFFEINQYYDDLEAAAPEGIRDAVAKVAGDWWTIYSPLSGEGEPEHGPGVEFAARSVVEFVGRWCGKEGGVYLTPLPAN